MLCIRHFLLDSLTEVLPCDASLDLDLAGVLSPFAEAEASLEALADISSRVSRPDRLVGDVVEPLSCPPEAILARLLTAM